MGTIQIIQIAISSLQVILMVAIVILLAKRKTENDKTEVQELAAKEALDKFWEVYESSISSKVSDEDEKKVD